MENKKKELLCIGSVTLALQYLESMQCISNKIFNIVTSDSNDDSGSEDEEEIVQASLAFKIRFEANRIEGFIERVVSNHSECEFQSHFRLTTKAFDFLLSEVTQNIDKAKTGRTTVDIKTQLLAVIWILANPECYRSVGERFNLAKSTLSDIFFRIVNVLNKLASKFIRWPNETEINDSRVQFELISGIKNCFGAIDGTYIAVKAPKEQAHCYVNRKKFHSITLQAICGYRMKFFDCSVGYPSSVHDARIFRNSAVYRRAETNMQTMFPMNSVILGDKAYPIKKWCIPPYIDNGRLTEIQKRFNRKHSQARQIIERSFALLFGRWRRLKTLNMNRFDAYPATVLACCTLHNICLNFPEELVQNYINEGFNIATENETVNYNNETENNNPTGEAHRDFMASEIE